MNRITKHLSRSYIACLVMIIAVLSINAYAGFFDYVKKPFEWVGDGIDFVSKNTIGRVVEGATDPAMARASDHMKDVINTAQAALDQEITNGISQADAMLNANIVKLATVLNKTIEQADSVLDKNIKLAAAQANEFLAKQEQVWNRTLDKQAAILDATATRLAACRS